MDHYKDRTLHFPAKSRNVCKIPGETGNTIRYSGDGVKKTQLSHIFIYIPIRKLCLNPETKVSDKSRRDGRVQPVRFNPGTQVSPMNGVPQGTQENTCRNWGEYM